MFLTLLSGSVINSQQQFSTFLSPSLSYCKLQPQRSFCCIKHNPLNKCIDLPIIIKIFFFQNRWKDRTHESYPEWSSGRSVKTLYETIFKGVSLVSVLCAFMQTCNTTKCAYCKSKDLCASTWPYSLPTIPQCNFPCIINTKISIMKFYTCLWWCKMTIVYKRMTSLVFNYLLVMTLLPPFLLQTEL